MGFLDRSKYSPAQFLTAEDELINNMNPDFLEWDQQDQLSSLGFYFLCLMEFFKEWSIATQLLKFGPHCRYISHLRFVLRKISSRLFYKTLRKARYP